MTTLLTATTDITTDERQATTAELETVPDAAAACCG